MTGKASEVTCRDIKALAESADFRELSARLDVPCPFEALGVVSHEIRHSNFLAYIVDPNKPHGFGDACLQAFLECLLAVGKTGIEVGKLPLSRARIYREYHYNDGGEKGFMDLVIEIPSHKATSGKAVVFVVEVKLGGGDHSRQLCIYAKIAKKKWPDKTHQRHLVYFVPVENPDPKHGDWHGVSFKSVADAFDALLKRGTKIGDCHSRWMLERYSTMIKWRYFTDDSLDGIARRLWNDHSDTLKSLIEWKRDMPAEITSEVDACADQAWRQHEASLSFLRDWKRDVHKKIIKKLDADKSLEKASLPLPLEKDYARGAFFRFAVPEWDAIPCMKSSTWTYSERIVLILVDFYAGRGLATCLYVGPGPQGTRQKFIEAIKTVCGEASHGENNSRFTEFCCEVLCDEATIKEMEAKGVDPAEVKKICDKFADHWGKILPKINAAFIRAEMLPPKK